MAIHLVYLKNYFIFFSGYPGQDRPEYNLYYRHCPAMYCPYEILKSYRNRKGEYSSNKKKVSYFRINKALSDWADGGLMQCIDIGVNIHKNVILYLQVPCMMDSNISCTWNLKPNNELLNHLTFVNTFM